ncbi:hypothetical protein B0H34DRAFT_843902 [Crassisporium funariophilum]|nr:hypothetical protein B0H34DRAFT_843902 [Crassisporium funariophilum]
MSTTTYLRCYCKKCSTTIQGYKLQTQSVISKHGKLYGPKTIENGPDKVAPQDNGTQELGGYQGQPEDALAAFGPDNYWDDGPYAGEQNAWEDQDEGNDDIGMQELPQQQPSAPILPWPRYPDTTWTTVPALNICAPGSDLDEEDRPDPVPTGLAEHPGVRMAYLQAVIQNVYAHTSVVQATEILNSTLDALSTMGPLPLNPRPILDQSGLSKAPNVD